MKFKLPTIALLTLMSALAACDKGAPTAPTDTTSAAAQVTALAKTDTVVGTGAQADSGKTLSVHYTGWLYDAKAPAFKGNKFDSSVDRGTPFSFRLSAGQVIPGWDQGVLGMKVGGKRTLTIPSTLGYGAQGTGPIPANATLVFDIELLGVQ